MKMKPLSLFVLACASLSGCSSPPTPPPASLTSLAPKDDASRFQITDSNPNQTQEIMDFGLDLLAHTEVAPNKMISPLSLASALGMTANGAEEETLHQMETVLGATREDLNAFLSTYLSNLPQTKSSSVHLSNSIWVKENCLALKDSFKDIVQNHYKASIYEAPFDPSTTQAINDWVSEETNRLIPTLLDKIDPSAFMYLINALAFKAEWEIPYEPADTTYGTFTSHDGLEQEAEFMTSLETNYLELENAVGFKKDYKDGSYAFVALLPDDDLSISDFISSLDSQTLLDILKAQTNCTVSAHLPKFNLTYSAELSNTLSEMGMPNAFEAADFTSFTDSENGLAVDEVLHKTTLIVDEKGTEAGAVTSVMLKECALELPDDLIEVHLDRPFMFMIIDTRFNLPLFMGHLSTLQ